MKTLYFFYAQPSYAQVFVDKDGRLIRAIHENDGPFRQEYMGFIATFFGGKTTQIELQGAGAEEDVAAFVTANQASILAAIVAADV